MVQTDKVGQDELATFIKENEAPRFKKCHPDTEELEAGDERSRAGVGR